MKSVQLGGKVDRAFEFYFICVGPKMSVEKFLSLWLDMNSILFSHLLAPL